MDNRSNLTAEEGQEDESAAMDWNSLNPNPAKTAQVEAEIASGENKELVAFGEGDLQVERNGDEKDGEETLAGLLEESQGEKKRKMWTEMNQESKQQRLSREKALKRPMIALRDGCPDDDTNLESTFGTVCDYESESEEDQEEGLAFENMPILEQSRQETCDLPNKFKKVISFMGGSNPQFVVEKKLSKADVDEKRNRLSLPLSKIEVSFLEVEEEEALNKEKWKMVEMIEPDASVSWITLSKWETKRGPSYVMITEWSEVLRRNKLAEGAKIQLWCFRVKERLCFALVEVQTERRDEDGSGGAQYGNL